MTRFSIQFCAALTLSLAVSAGAFANDAAPPWPEAVRDARLVPGGPAEGAGAGAVRLAGFALDLAPGWKTYWRRPGDAGIAPDFDWSGSDNLGALRVIWPAPELFLSDGLRSIGYHDQMVLPLEITPRDPARPVRLRLSADLGICETICVPLHLELSADLPAPEDAAAVDQALIGAALAQVPQPGAAPEACGFAPIRDGARVTMDLPRPPPAGSAAIIESLEEGVWVSEAEISGVRVSADLVPPDGRPFEPDLTQLRLTLLGGDAARDITGCPAG